METSSLEIAFIAGGFTIIGTLLGTWLGYRFSLQTMRISTFNRAVTRFRTAFMEIREVLDPAEFALKENLAIFLEDRFLEHRRAVMEFSDFLDSDTKARFLDTWREYYKVPGYKKSGSLTPHFAQYNLGDDATTKEKNEMKKLIKSRIEKMLEFAKPI